MQRNMDLIRQLLLGIEGEPSTQYEFNIQGVGDLEKWYNVDLLVEANFIRGVQVHWAADGTGPYTDVKGLVGLTWDGHDFLDAVRNDSVWQKVKNKVHASGLDIQSLTFDVIKSLSVSFIKANLGL